jgi:hypothetical protein
MEHGLEGNEEHDKCCDFQKIRYNKYTQHGNILTIAILL